VSLALLLTLAASAARAHRLNAEFRVLPGKQVRVESWFETGDSPKGAQVRVLGEDGEPIIQGGLSSQGLFLFAYDEAQPLRVVIDAGDHRKELAIAAADLAAGSGGDTPAGRATDAALARRESDVTAKDILMGVAFLLALAAFVLGLRNARQLRDLTRPKGGPPGSQ
jgi:hypothetical protein